MPGLNPKAFGILVQPAHKDVAITPEQLFLAGTAQDAGRLAV